MKWRTPTILIVMGVSGSGKTTIGRRLADALDCPFLEGDELHPPANVEKMRSGMPLTDEDRLPWLQRIAAEIATWRAAGGGGVVTCSALKRAYRDILGGGRGDVTFIYLKGDRALLERRLAARRGHFMPASLLASQFDALEEPGGDEACIAVDIDAPPDEIVRTVTAALASHA